MYMVSFSMANAKIFEDTVVSNKVKYTKSCSFECSIWKQFCLLFWDKEL